MFCLLLVLSVVLNQMQSIFGYEIKNTMETPPFCVFVIDVCLNANFGWDFCFFVCKEESSQDIVDNLRYLFPVKKINFAIQVSENLVSYNCLPSFLDLIC